jgi:hypothetical protein
MKTSLNENRRNQKAYLYGTVLWFICKDPTPTKRIKALAYSMNAGNNLHDYFVAAGVIEKVAYGKYKAVSQVGPSLEICVNCYDAQTKRANQSKVKSKSSPELFTEEPASVQELTVESLAQQVFKLTEIMNKLVNQTPTKNP